MTAPLYTWQTTSRVAMRKGTQEKVVSSQCIRMFFVRPILCHSTCSVVYSLLGVHLCRTGRQKQTQASTLWEQVIAANTNGLAVTTVHFTVLLKDVNRWSVTAGSGEEWESGIFELWIQRPVGCHQLWRRGAGGCWPDSNQCVLSMRQMLQTKANHSFPSNVTTHPFDRAVKRSWSHQVSLAVTANPIYHDTCSVTLTLTQDINMITRALWLKLPADKTVFQHSVA